MTDHPPPLSDDELDLAASLAIDGQAFDGRPLSADDRERVDERALELQAAVDAVAEPVPAPPAETRAAQLAAAVAASGGGETMGVGAAATPLRPARAGRGARRRVRAAAPWAAAAAVAAVVVIAVAALAGHHQQDEKTSAASATGATTTAPTSTTVPSFSPVESALPSDALADLGTVADAGALASRVRAESSSALAKSADQSTSGQQTTSTPPSYRSTCSPALATLEPRVGAVVYQAQAVLGTTPVQVLVYEPADRAHPARQLVALDRASCRVLVDRPL